MVILLRLSDFWLIEYLKKEEVSPEMVRASLLAVMMMGRERFKYMVTWLAPAFF